MNTLKFIIMLLFSLSVALSCSTGDGAKRSTDINKKIKVEPHIKYPITIDVAGNMDKKRVLKLSEVAESIEYVPLETKKSSMVGRPLCYSITDDFIFLRGYGGPIYKFSRSGKFIKKFGRVGKGPSEFSQYAKFTTDNRNKLISVYDYNKHRFLFFDFDGKFISSTIACRGDYEDFGIANGRPVISYGIHYGIQKHRLLVCNRDGSYADSLPNRDKFKHKKRTMSFFGDFDKFMSYHNDTLLYKGQYNDTAFQVLDNGVLKAKYVINHGEFKIPLKERIEYVLDFKRFNRSAKGYFKTKVMESDKYLFIPRCGYVQDSYPKFSVYNKQTNDYFNLVDSTGKHKRIINDIDGGIDFFPNIVVRGDQVADFFSAVDFKSLYKKYARKELLTNKTANTKLLNILSSLNENSNPIFMFVKLK